MVVRPNLHCTVVPSMSPVHSSVHCTCQTNSPLCSRALCVPVRSIPFALLCTVCGCQTRFPLYCSVQHACQTGCVVHSSTMYVLQYSSAQCTCQTSPALHSCAKCVCQTNSPLHSCAVCDCQTRTVLYNRAAYDCFVLNSTSQTRYVLLRKCSLCCVRLSLLIMYSILQANDSPFQSLPLPPTPPVLRQQVSIIQ